MDSKKAIGLFNLKLNDILSPFRGYGQDVFIPEVKLHIIEHALLLHERLKEVEHTKIPDE